MVAIGTGGRRSGIGHGLRGSTASATGSATTAAAPGSAGSRCGTCSERATAVPATVAARSAAEARYGDLARLPGTLAAGDQVAATTAAFTPDVVAGRRVRRPRGARRAGRRRGGARPDPRARPRPAAAPTGDGRRRPGRRAIAGGRAAPAHLPGGLTVVPSRPAPRSTAPCSWRSSVVNDLSRTKLGSTCRPSAIAGHPYRARPARRPDRRDAGLDLLATEQVRPDLDDLDRRSPSSSSTCCSPPRRPCLPPSPPPATSIAAAVALAEKALLAGGRLVYVGAGTPGRLAAQDAAEIPPTFGTDPSRVVAVLAGGGQAAAHGRRRRRGPCGRRPQPTCSPSTRSPTDLVVGIAASGRTPYVLEALRSRPRAGRATVAIVNNPRQRRSPRPPTSRSSCSPARRCWPGRPG